MESGIGPGRRSFAELLGRQGQLRRRSEYDRHAARDQYLLEPVSLGPLSFAEAAKVKAKQRRKVSIIGR